jgi:DNA primase
MGLDWLVQKDMYASYLRRLDGRALLDHYGAEHRSEQANKDGSTEILHSCLIDRIEPHHSHGDENPSACLNVEKKVYCCYAGGWSGDLFHLVMKLEGIETFNEVLPKVNDFLTGATVEVEELQAELARFFEDNPAYSLNLPAYDESVLAAFDHPHVYWNHRGINKETQELLKLGYDPAEKRIVFPHFVDDNLVGWQKRVVPGETFPQYPKYRNSPGFPKSETLYAHDLCDPRGPVIVVESPMSVAKAYSIGLIHGTVVATFGASVNQRQIDLLVPHERVIIWFDADPGGMKGEKLLLDGLWHHTEVYRVKPTKGKDLGDIADVEEFARYTFLHTMEAHARQAEIKFEERFRR